MNAIPAELLDASLTALAAALRRGDVSGSEVAEASLTRLERLQPQLHCCIRIDPDRTREAAIAADRRRSRGESLGPLHGVPLAHKDIFYRAGRPTTCGSRIFADHVPAETATVLQRLDAAGALDVATLNMAEFAAGGSGHNAHWGDCRNPWNLEYSPGGSSSGSAAAVAARGVFGSLGSDTGGSLRWPASLCGVTTIRPTLGRVSTAGVAPRAWSLDAVGPMARSAEDCALLLEAIAGPMGLLDRPVEKLRIGVPGDGWRADVPAEAAAALEKSLETFRALGAEIVEVALPDPEVTFRLGDLIVRAEAAALHRRWLRERPHDYSHQVRSQLESGLAISAAQYLDALRLRAPLLQEFTHSAFSRVDVLHLPVHPFAAPKMADLGNDPGSVAQFWSAYPRLTRPFSYLGLPALAMPGGMSHAGIPIGIQLAGPPFSEGTLLAAAHAYQQATKWHLLKPPISV